MTPERNAAKLLYDMTPGGSEFHNDPDRCAEFLKARLGQTVRFVQDRNAARGELKVALAHIQALEEANARFVKLVPTGKFPVAESLEVRAVLSDAKKLLASAALSPAPATKGQPHDSPLV